jgi:hypothetical protein
MRVRWPRAPPIDRSQWFICPAGATSPLILGNSLLRKWLRAGTIPPLGGFSDVDGSPFPATESRQFGLNPATIFPASTIGFCSWNPIQGMSARSL